MTKIYLTLIVLSLLGSRGITAQEKAVFILLDGIPADVLEKVDTPAMDEIATAGGYSRAYVGGEKGGYTETPTVSAPGYMNMITGTWAHKHNVRDNAVENPNYHYWNIFRVAKKADPNLQTALFSTWEDNRTKLIGEGKPEAGGRLLDHWSDGFENDTVRFPHQPDRKFIFHIDELVSQQAAGYIAQEGPDLSWVYLEFTDDMGHKFGDSPEMNDAVRKADVQVKRIWEAVKKREKEHGENWMVVITTDHGRNSEGGKSHGKQSERERTTWVVTNSDRLNSRFGKQPAIVDIMPSILRHMAIKIPDRIRAEMDGVPFIDEVSIDNLQAKVHQGKLQTTWDAIEETGEMEIYVATSNNFMNGGKDNYEKVATLPVKERKCSLPLSAKSSIYKVLVKAPHNWMNVWIENP